MYNSWLSRTWGRGRRDGGGGGGGDQTGSLKECTRYLNLVREQLVQEWKQVGLLVVEVVVEVVVVVQLQGGHSPEPEIRGKEMEGKFPTNY